MLASSFLAADVALQAGVDIPQSGGQSLIGSAISAFLTTIIVGAILVAVTPAYTDRLLTDVFDEPGSAFLYGFGSVLSLALLSVLLVLTVFGVLFAIPLIVVTYLVWAVGATIGFLAISDRLVGHDDGWLKPLLVAAGLNGGLALTGIGGIVSFVVGAVGFGAILRDYLA